MNFGTVPDWLVGIVAILALWWARTAALAATKTNQQQAVQIEALQEERRERQRVEERQQAAAVVLWAVVEPQANDYQVRLANTSTLPVQYLVVSFSEWLHVPRADVLKPTNEHQDLFFDVLLTNQRDLRLGNDGRPLPDEIVISFTDMTGRRWSRNLIGEITPIDLRQMTKFHEIGDERLDTSKSGFTGEMYRRER